MNEKGYAGTEVWFEIGAAFAMNKPIYAKSLFKLDADSEYDLWMIDLLKRIKIMDISSSVRDYLENFYQETT